jgi:rhodanese-related sulfurtransferase
MQKEEIHKALLDYVNSVGKNWNYIPAPELRKLNTKNYFLLDVRNPKDFKKAHIKGAQNIFWLDLLKPINLKKLPKNKTIVIICYVGHTASQMLVALRLLGYKAVVLKFGMGQSPVAGIPVAGWTNYGFEVVCSKN